LNKRAQESYLISYPRRIKKYLQMYIRIKTDEEKQEKLFFDGCKE